MNKNMGPILYDSLDRPNSDKRPQINKTHGSDYKTIAVILFFSTIIIGAVFVYVIRSLHYQAEFEYDKQAVFLLSVINISVVTSFVALLLGAVYTLISWLVRWAKKNGILSLYDGPHYDIFSVQTRQYNEVFTALIDRFYTVMEERAKQSQYQGASTITVSEGNMSLTNTVKETEKPKETAKEAIQEPINVTHTMKDLDHEN